MNLSSIFKKSLFFGLLGLTFTHSVFAGTTLTLTDPKLIEYFLQTGSVPGTDSMKQVTLLSCVRNLKVQPVERIELNLNSVDENQFKDLENQLIVNSEKSGTIEHQVFENNRGEYQVLKNDGAIVSNTVLTVKLISKTPLSAGEPKLRVNGFTDEDPDAPTAECPSLTSNL